MAPEICHTCRFYCTTSAGGPEGECRRYPPILIELLVAARKRLTMDVEDCFEGYWPLVAKSDWCGEYRPK